MQVAVAGVEDVRNRQGVLARELGDLVQHLGNRERGIVPSMQ